MKNEKRAMDASTSESKIDKSENENGNVKEKEKEKEKKEQEKEKEKAMESSLGGTAALRAVVSVAFTSLTEVEKELLNVRMDKKVCLRSVRASKTKLRESLLALGIDCFTEEEKKIMTTIDERDAVNIRAATMLQRNERSRAARKQLGKQKKAAVTIQCSFRSSRARRRAIQERIRARENERVRLQEMEKKTKELEKKCTTHQCS